MHATTANKPKPNRQQALADALRADPEIPVFAEEYLGIPGKRYRFDFAWPALMVSVEVDGGTWTANTGHSSGAGIRAGNEKANLAQMYGWTHLRYTSDQIREKAKLAQTIAQIKEALAMHEVPARIFANVAAKIKARSEVTA